MMKNLFAASSHELSTAVVTSDLYLCGVPHEAAVHISVNQHQLIVDAAL